MVQIESINFWKVTEMLKICSEKFLENIVGKGEKILDTIFVFQRQKKIYNFLNLVLNDFCIMFSLLKTFVKEVSKQPKYMILYFESNPLNICQKIQNTLRKKPPENIVREWEKTGLAFSPFLALFPVVWKTKNHYHTMRHFEALKIFSCGKHCDKRRNCL